MLMERKWGKGNVSGRLGLNLLLDSPYSIGEESSLEPMATQSKDHISQPPMAAGPCDCLQGFSLYRRPVLIPCHSSLLPGFLPAE